MTIALGLLADDGVVIAADTQETVHGYWKRREGKIRAIQNKNGAVVVSGAGRAMYADALGDCVLDVFLGSSDWFSDNLIQSIEDVLVQFHRQHVAPYHDLPEVQLLIGWQASGERSSNLIATDRSAIVSAINKGQVAVGIGAGEVQPLLNQIYDQQLGWDVIDAAVLAAYAVYHAKQKVDGCGHISQIAYIRDGRMNGISHPYIQRLESAFEDYAELAEPLLQQFLLGRSARLGADGVRLLRRCREDIMGVTERKRRVEATRARQGSTRDPSDLPPLPE